MISVTSAQLDAWLATLIFPLTRILAVIASSPVFGNKQVPARVKIGLSVLLAIIIAPTIGEMPQVPVGSPQGLLIMVQQIIIGFAMGFTMRLVFTAVEMAGELAGLQMGLGFASFYDPLNSAYTPIVAGGANGCVLHYVGNNAALKDGDLLLIDAGCEVDGYAADITRTFPVNGKFSAAQKDVYEMVLAAQAAAIGSARPGVRWNEPHDAALRVLAQGMIDLGLCQGSLDAVLESESYKRFYMHRTGHWLGMDVHDVGDYKVGEEWRLLEPGMVMTVEPGIYIAPGSRDVHRRWWGIGVRIEDDVLVTRDGYEVLTDRLPRDPAAVEALVGQAA